MKGHDCEKEQQVADALRSDLFSEELRKHAEQCPICSEVILVADFLRQETDRTDNEFGILPDARLVWRKAQDSAREEALLRATLPIRIARGCAAGVAVLASPWLVIKYQLWQWVAELWLGQMSPLNRLWPSNLARNSLLLALTAALLWVGLSSWYIAREE